MYTERSPLNLSIKRSEFYKFELVRLDEALVIQDFSHFMMFLFVFINVFQ